MTRYKIFSVFCKLVVFAVFGSAFVFAQVPPTSFVVINEIQVNNPGGDLPTCEYIELRGDPNTEIDNELYILEVEGDGGVAGNVDFALNLSGLTFGTNGILTVSFPEIVGPLKEKTNKSRIGDPPGTPCGNRDYTSDGGAFADGNFTLENGTISFLLVSTEKSVIDVNDDFDTDNNGTLDNLPFDGTIVDAVGWSDGGGTDWVYGGVDITPSTGTPDAATRNFNNVTPLDTTAWFADDIVDTGSVDSVQYDLTNLLGGYRIDFITPGRQNLAPNSAPGIISGRARNTSGQGLKHVVLMLSGGSLQEPIYATTNQFGSYRFEDIPVGESYVLQAISGRFTFQNPSRVINFDESTNDADFFGEEIGTK